MPSPDHALARRLEAAEAYNGLKMAEAIARHHPDADAAVETIAGGYAVYCGVGSPLSLVALSRDRGYRITEWDNVYSVPLRGLQVREVSAPGVDRPSRTSRRSRAVERRVDRRLHRRLRSRFNGTMPGTTSQRNVERHGFRVAYTRTKLFKPPS
jgi:hypothetical protein